MRTLKFNQRYIAYPLLLFFFSPFAQADMFSNVDWLANTDVSIGYNNNVNNAIKVDQMKGAMVTSVGVSATGIYVTEDGRSNVTLTGDVKREENNHILDLNNNAMGAILAYRKKWGLGPFAPWVGLSLSATNLNYNDPYRDGWRNQIAARVGKRVHERWDLRAEYVVEQRTTDTVPPPRVPTQTLSSDVFSQDSQAMMFNAEYTWSDSLFLGFGTLYRYGDVIASTIGGSQGGSNFGTASTAIARDRVFGSNYVAYTMDGTTYGLNVDMKIALDHKNSLNASMARYVTHATSDNNYNKTVQTVSWIHNF